MNKTFSCSLFIIPYFVMLVIGLTVPSVAYHGILNPKSLIYAITIASICFYVFIRKKINIKQINILFFLLSSTSFLLLWFLFGIINDESNLPVGIDQIKIFIITLTVPTLTLFLLNEEKISEQAVFKTVIYSNLAYCTLKLIAIVLHFTGLINIWDILEVLGFRVMTMSIFGTLQRLQSSLDISTPFILLFVLQSDYLGFHLSRRLKVFYITISLISNFLAFSRFLLFIYAFSFTLYFLTQSFSRLTKGLFIGFIFLMTIVMILGTDNLATSFQQRFFSKASHYSDHVRWAQYDALMQEHEEAPYLGKGLGSYSKNLIRDHEIKHSYEVQWVAFLMQFGIIGITLLLIPIGIIIFGFLQYPLTRIHLSFLSLFLLWILSGFTNPFLISLQSGIIYTLFLITPFSLFRKYQTSVN